MTVTAALSQQLLAKINMNEFKTGLTNGNFADEHPDVAWEIRKTDLADNESQYETVVSWNEHGQQKAFSCLTNRFEYKNKLL